MGSIRRADRRYNNDNRTDMIPKHHQWLSRIGPLPKMVDIALDYYGETEIPGAQSNLLFLDWSSELGLQNSYRNDDTAWCGLFVAMLVHRTKRTVVKNPLWARNWAVIVGSGMGSNHE
mgnify:CR=1 FL=1